jgi:hypothetical protein
MRLEAGRARAAQEFVAALEQAGPVIAHCQDREVQLLWPAVDADDADEWDEETFAELVFFLRAWSGGDPERLLTILDERPLDVPAEVFRLAS